ncbi:MAG: alpha/beta hydrolase [Rhizobiales bacterium 12-66-7]|nr:MAG: alpha/beta hydrolase [Rhizobiales bacterium 12-66-7]OYX74425.1 MAG: alpha/beta hydrolase [Rhizobiales bacterium 32-66-11]
MPETLEQAPTRFVEASGVRFAYRRLGPDTGIPLVLLQHFTGTMDAWDPAVVNALALDRPVIAFDNTGVGASSGETPDSVERQAADAEAFIAALGLRQVDLLGFSLGGFLAQVMVARSALDVRRIILVGTAPRGGEEHLLRVVEEAFGRGARDVRLPLFFTSSAASQAAGVAFVDRASARQIDRDPDRGEAVSTPQAQAIIRWCAQKEPGHASLKAIRQPALIVHGSDDTMFPSINAYQMFKNMNNATLIIYPDSGHGALFQEPGRFVAHVNTFLDA